MTDFRALCTELVEAWDSHSYADAGDAADRMAEAVKAARAALAQPAPPAEGEVGELEPALPLPTGKEPTRLRNCPTHGQQPPWAWGCPECVRQLREELAALQQRHPEPVPVSERLPKPGEGEE